MEHVRPREPRYGKPASPIHPLLQERLRSLGLHQLYSHQAMALDLARSGANVMVATPSASGKTLCYNLPIAERLLTDRRARVLYLFPTKALAQDQMRTLVKFLGEDIISGEECGLFDGDTPQEARREVKRRARVIMTNPDMLHLGILPNHVSWARVLRNLRYVVVDEAHVYRGIFGSHVANVLRRLRRLCTYYGSSPQFIASSASIGNPREHIEKLVGLPFEIVDLDGSPYGSKYFVFWNPPLLGKANGSRRSSNSEATGLLVQLVREGVRTLVFARTRRVTELIYLYVRRELALSALADRVMPYRAGYTPEDRRDIERRLFEGELLGAVATTALELGIDIGDLDATVLTGYPGSIASTWQQAGRSGRRRGDSLSVLVGLDNPLDQYLMRHPESFFARPFEHALINPDNPHILLPHLLCAAWELPLAAGDEPLFGPAFVPLSAHLQETGSLVSREVGVKDQQTASQEVKVRQGLYVAPRVSYPAQDVSIRSSSQMEYAILDVSRGDILLETVEGSVALFQIHPGAVYLHQGEPYLVIELNLENRTAFVRPAGVDYYTQAKDLTDLRVLSVLRSKRCGRAWVYFGEVDVRTQVVGFKRKKQFTDEVLGEELLELPEQRFRTQAVWFSLPDGLEERLSRGGLDLAGGLHATEHAAIAMLPLFALCDRNDIGGVSTAMHPDTGEAGVFIHDAYPGGVGIAEVGYESIRGLWQAALRVVTECPCQEGCPSCVYSPKCGNNNEPMDKEAARVLLQSLLT
ncbi:MAG: DEAD/DEAH box helicase [Chloroflexota bacterium]